MQNPSTCYCWSCWQLACKYFANCLACVMMWYLTVCCLQQGWLSLLSMWHCNILIAIFCIFGIKKNRANRGDFCVNLCAIFSSWCWLMFSSLIQGTYLFSLNLLILNSSNTCTNALWQVSFTVYSPSKPLSHINFTSSKKKEALTELQNQMKRNKK